MATPEFAWPTGKKGGGSHRTGRYVLALVSVALGSGILAGWPSVVPGLTGTVTGVAAAFVSVMSSVDAHLRKCPGYAVLGIDTCDLSARGAPGGHAEST